MLKASINNTLAAQSPPSHFQAKAVQKVIQAKMMIWPDLTACQRRGLTNRIGSLASRTLQGQFSAKCPDCGSRRWRGRGERQEERQHLREAGPSPGARGRQESLLKRAWCQVGERDSPFALGQGARAGAESWLPEAPPFKPLVRSSERPLSRLEGSSSHPGKLVQECSAPCFKKVHGWKANQSYSSGRKGPAVGGGQ